MNKSVFITGGTVGTGLAAAERKKKGVAFKDLNGLKLHNALVDTGAMRADD